MNKLFITLTLWALAALTATADNLMDEVRKNLGDHPTVKNSYIKYGETFAGKPWLSPAATSFAEFKTNGNRTRFEAQTFAKRRQLAALVMAEVAEGKGRFMGDIIDGLTSTLEETWWGLPAHYGTKVMRPEDQNVDLFNAETAGLVVWTKRALREQLDAFSPIIAERIDKEIERRILKPAVETDYWWKRAGMNWNPWICSNWAVAVKECEHDSARYHKAMEQIEAAMECFVKAYPDDGGCDEGPTYWDRAAASLHDCMTVAKAPADFDKICRMGAYCYSTYIADGYCLNFADSHGNRFVQQPNVMYPFGVTTGDRTMQEFAAYIAKEKGFWEDAARMYDTSGNYPTLGRELTFLSMLDDFSKVEPREPNMADTWLQRLQIFSARRNGMYVAMKGGHNDESHNHNDVGSFVIYHEGKPILADPGVGEYTSQTFGKGRYDIWTMQSAYHNLPQINGCDQMAGKHFAARDVIYKKGRLTMDIAGAYPDSAGVRRWTRTVSISSKGEVKVVEDYDLSRQGEKQRLMLIAAVEPKIVKDGIVIGSCRMEFDKTVSSVDIEPLKDMFDPMMESMWPGGLWRIVLTVDGASGHKGMGKVTVRVFPCPSRGC